MDDDSPIRALIAASFKREGIVCEQAEDGEVAIERLQSAEYKVILLDLMMPNVSGMDVLAYMKEHAIETPVIVMSAASQQLLDTVSREYPYEIVRKPFDVGALMVKVRALCDARQTSQ